MTTSFRMAFLAACAILCASTSTHAGYWGNGGASILGAIAGFIIFDPLIKHGKITVANFCCVTSDTWHRILCATGAMATSYLFYKAHLEIVAYQNRREKHKRE